MTKSPLTSAYLAALALSSAMVACTPPPPAPVNVAVRVVADTGAPVERARLLSGSATVALTDATGVAHIAVNGLEGQTFQVDVKCPAGFRSPVEPLLVRRFNIAATTDPEYRVSCQSTRHSMVIVVRADGGPDLPVIYLGKEIARTDSSGAASVMMEMDVHDRVELTLSTAGKEKEKIHPQNPVAVFEMADHEDVQVFAVAFTRDKKKPPRAAAPPRGPVVF
jgi:hypothetical protein